MDDQSNKEIIESLKCIEKLLEQLVENTRPLTPGEILDRDKALGIESLRRSEEYFRLHPERSLSAITAKNQAETEERKKASNHPDAPPEKSQ